MDTWHGIPLKTIGFDIPAGKVSAGNTVRNFLAADYLIAPNHFMTEIYENAFKMKNLYPGKILEIGQPRNDSYFHTDREAIFKKLQMAGVEADPKKKLILYHRFHLILILVKFLRFLEEYDKYNSEHSLPAQLD